MNLALIDNFNQAILDNPSESVLKYYKGIKEITELDNRGYEITRPLFSHSSLPFCLEMYEIEYSEDNVTDNFNYFYFLHVHHNQTLWVKYIHLIPSYILDLVRNGKCKLIFDNTLEGNRVDGRYFIEPFYKKIKELNLPFENVFFVTNNLFAEQTHNDWFSLQKEYDKKLNIISFMWNVYDVQRLKNEGDLPKSINIINEIKYKEKNIDNIRHFLKVNRTDRIERNLFMLFLNKNNLLNKSFISFPSFPNYTYPSDFNFLTDIDNIKNVKLLTPFNIDKTDEENQGPPGIGKGHFNADLPFNPIHYKNTFLSIVMCAFPFEPNACHLHSSTFNPIYCGHPIIQFGPYQSLNEMKKRGFKTFENWWNEDYDEEKNDYIRLKKVMDVVKHISKKTKKEMIDMVTDMKEVLQHNSDLINNYSLTKELKEKILK